MQGSSDMQSQIAPAPGEVEAGLAARALGWEPGVGDLVWRCDVDREIRFAGYNGNPASVHAPRFQAGAIVEVLGDELYIVSIAPSWEDWRFRVVAERLIPRYP